MASAGQWHLWASHVCVLSHFSTVWLFGTPWTTARQVPLSLGFSRQESWSGLPRPPPGHLPDPGIEPASLMSPALAGGFFTTEPLGKVSYHFESADRLLMISSLPLAQPGPPVKGKHRCSLELCTSYGPKFLQSLAKAEHQSIGTSEGTI